MNSDDIEARVKNIDERTQRIEQILPTLATKDDLKGFATKDDLKDFPTRDDLKGFATKDDLKGFPTKDDPKGFAMKDDLKAFPTRDEMTTTIHEEGRRTRAHFDVVAEDLKENIKVIAEGHKSLETKVDSLAAESRKELAAHDRRIMKLEAGSLKRH